MKLLLNDKEIAHFLIFLIDHKLECLKVQKNDRNLSEALGWALEKRGKNLYIPKKYVEKAKDKIQSAIYKDTKEWFDNLETLIENRKDTYFEKIHKNIDYFINKIGIENIFQAYKKSKKQNFVKSTGIHIDSNSEFIRRKDFFSFDDDCLIRNTVGNESLLVSKIDNKYPFWFIDSGYTNFLEPNKKWHRLVRNHLHYGSYFDAPSDRLNFIKKFPEVWRESGEFILIVEPGPFAANIFHADIKTWKYEIEKELRQYTDKKIKFREKFPKKERTNLYQELRDEDYYCVVNINSNAATESIWAGVPVITLDKHVTNPVTKNKISEINNLYRGPLGNWLCYLTYNQFTYEELINGSAYNIIKQYHV